MRATILLVAALAAAGCDKGDDKKPAGAAAVKEGAPDPVIEAWTKAGLTVSAFEAADGAKYGGGDCKSGQVNGVDVALCQYASEALAKGAEPKGLEAIGETTGVSLAHGVRLLVVADRRKADPEGRTINQLSKLFVGKPVSE
jgi:hypothetical protein